MEAVVTRITPEFDEEIPKWDIALESLAKEEYRALGRGLAMADFRRLAERYSIRLDDILVTMFELVIQGEWVYQAVPGAVQPITREVLNNLYVGGRLHAKDVENFTGSWRLKSA